MPLYVVCESISTHKKIVTFKGVIKGDSFYGIWSGNPLTGRGYGSWLIKRKGDVVMENLLP